MTAHPNAPTPIVHLGEPHYHGKASHEHPYDPDEPHQHSAELAHPSSPAPRGYSATVFHDEK